MKKLVGILLTFALLMVASLPCLATAEEIKPVVTISFAGYEEVRANIETIGKLGGNAKLADGLENLLEMMTQGKGLSSLDKKAPWGAVVQLGEDGSRSIFAFVPVIDLKQLMEILKNTPVGGGITESDGVYEVAAPNGESYFIAQRGKIAAIVQDKSLLEDVSAEPEKLLGDLPKKYLVAVRFSIKNIPEGLRDQYLGMFTMMSQVGVQQEENETDEQFARRESSSKRSLEKIMMLAKETDQIVIGTNIDRSTNKINLDIDLVADEGSKLAAELTKNKPGKTNFAGFDLPNATLVANSIGTLTDQDVADTKEDLQVLFDRLLLQVENQELTEAQVKLVKEMINEATAIIGQNLEAKKTDAGFAVCLDPSALTLAAGMGVVDGKPLDNLIKKFFDAVKEEEPALANAVKFNAETYKDFRIHTITIPVTEDIEMLKPFIGDNLDVVLGIGNKQAFVVAGRDAFEVLKKAIDQCQATAGKEVQPFQMSVSALQIAKFVAEVAPEEQAKAVAQKIIDALEQSKDKDHLVVTGLNIANGMQLHLELEEGFLKAVSGLVPMMGGMGGMPPGAPAGPGMPGEMPSPN